MAIYQQKLAKPALKIYSMDDYTYTMMTSSNGNISA